MCDSQNDSKANRYVPLPLPTSCLVPASHNDVYSRLEFRVDSWLHLLTELENPPVRTVSCYCDETAKLTNNQIQRSFFMILNDVS